ncbi:MAG TPA: hypothetical protein VFO89_10940 [Thermoanaerobaculia bacterium]|nr:hypothetical protein [Thermoanaerobaculia bacterium]
MTKTCLGLILIVAALACAGPAVRPAGETALVLPTLPLPAELQQASVAFDDWLRASVRQPGAVFRVLRVGADRDGVQTAFLSHVPQSWGSNAVAKRDAFAARERARFRAFVAGRSTPVPRIGPAAAGRTQLAILPVLDSRGRRWTFEESTVPSHTATLCDRSPSAAGIACTTTSLGYSYDAWLPGALAGGSTYSVWIIGRDASTTTRIFEVRTPDLPRAERVAYLLGARNELARLTDAAPPSAGSGVAQAITVAALDLVPRGGQRALWILSDLRQTSGPWAFDRRVPEPHAFLRWVKDERLLPACPGIEIVACGLHFSTTDRRRPFDVRRGVAIRELWTAALALIRPRAVALCSVCDADAFTRSGEDAMSSRKQKDDRRETITIGSNRGGRAFVDAIPTHAAEAVAAWSFVDAKPGRATDLARVLHRRFPKIRTAAFEADGREAARELPNDALIVSTVDTVDATRAIIGARRDGQDVLFQLVGRGSGAAHSAAHLGLSGSVRDAATQDEARLLLDGFNAISAAASSRALTAAGDPVSAAMLEPMRGTTTRKTARYFADVLEKREVTDAPLSFFTSAGQFPLVVVPNVSARFSGQKDRALAAIERLPVRRMGIIAAVAMVDVEEQSIDVLFVDRTRTDRRRVDGVMAFRAATQPFAESAIFTD